MAGWHTVQGCPVRSLQFPSVYLVQIYTPCIVVQLLWHNFEWMTSKKKSPKTVILGNYFKAKL